MFVVQLIGLIHFVPTTMKKKSGFGGISEEENEFDVDEPEEIQNNASDDYWTPDRDNSGGRRTSTRLRNLPKSQAPIVDASSTDEEGSDEGFGLECKTPKGRARGRPSPKKAKVSNSTPTTPSIKSEKSVSSNSEPTSTTNTINNLANSTPTVIELNKDFASGAFVILKTDAANLEQDPPLWKIDGKALMQKYIPFQQDGKTYYKNTSVYSGWTINNKDNYYPVSVVFKQQTRKEHIVEFHRDQLKLLIHLVPTTMKKKSGFGGISEEENEFDVDEPEEIQIVDASYTNEEASDEGFGLKRKTPKGRARGRPSPKKAKVSNSTPTTPSIKSDKSVSSDSEPTSTTTTTTTINNLANSTPTVIKLNKDFASGAFVILKTDAANQEQDPPLWKIDGKALMQKYIPFQQDGKTYYKNTAEYSSWTINNKDNYYPVSVVFKQQTRKEHIVEFHRDQLKLEGSSTQNTPLKSVLSDCSLYQSGITKQVVSMMDESDSDNAETSESEASGSSLSSNDSSSSTEALNKRKKKKGSLPKKPIEVVRHALKKLVNDDLPVMGNKSSTGTKNEDRDFFCIEDTFLTKDLKLYVEDLGQISFPLKKNAVEQMIKLSSKAKFGKGKETLLDTSVRDTQTIPASKLKIEINNTTLEDLLKRIGSGLNVGKNCKLIPHLHNLLIYGPGQFFKKHTDSEKVPNMIATLVIILPYPHEGGELVIEHTKKKHMFFGSKNPDVTKCVAFYSDCAHEIKKVTNGYRVAITYNVVLQPPDIPNVANISETLDIAVDNYFQSGETKLAFGLNHSYSKKSLKWNFLKGADRPRVDALLAVAKKQGRIPCLALTTYHEIYDKENTHYCPWESPVLVDEETSINFMIDENSAELKCQTEDNNISNNKEYCCTKKAKELFKPYETEASGPTGNEGDTEENWYRRACLVLWSNKWAYTQGFKEALGKLHRLTKEDGMQTILKEKINKARKDISQPNKWVEPSIAEMLLDIVIYLNDKEEAKFFLGDLCEYITNEDRIDRLLQLEKMFDDQTWSDIVKIWKDNGYHGGWHNVVSNAHTFLDRYIALGGEEIKSVIVNTILEEGVERFIKSEKYTTVRKYVYYRIREDSIESMSMFMKICSLLGNKSLEESLINHVVGASYPAVSLGELYVKLMDDLKPEHLSSYEIIRNMAEKSIKARLSKLRNETGWALPVEDTCSCKICSPVFTFFASKTSNKSHVIEGTKKTYDHLYDKCYIGLHMYSLPCKWSHNRDGKKKPYKLTIEKLPELLEHRKKLNDDLVKCQEKIDRSNPMLFVNVKAEIEAEFENPLDISSIEITENIKTELFEPFTPVEQVYIKSEQERIDSSFEPFTPVEQVDIKSEQECIDSSFEPFTPVEQVDMKSEQERIDSSFEPFTPVEQVDIKSEQEELPKKRRRRFK